MPSAPPARLVSRERTGGLARHEPWLIATALTLAWLIADPRTADLAAQVYRSELFDRAPFALWDSGWFAGHHLPGYSVLFPPLAALLGPRLVGGLAGVAAAAVFAQLAHGAFGARARLGSAWFGAATAVDVVVGRLTFALGLAIGLGALLALQRRHRRLAAWLALATPLASPVAGAFLALCACAAALSAPSHRRAAGAVAVLALAPAVALALSFPEGGAQPFLGPSLAGAVGFSIGAVVLLPREQRMLRVGVAAFGLACIAAFVLPTPMGSNVLRLGMLFGGPLLACTLWGRRNLVLALVALPLAWWQWSPGYQALRDASGDRATHAAYFNPLLGFLERASGGAPVRVEVPLTRNRWESVYVARRFPLARGWERQLDVARNALFYRGVLTPERYRHWLDSLAVSYVALAAAQPDRWARSEVRLVRGGLPYLRPVWRSRDWRVFAVADPTPLASGPGRVVAIDARGFTVAADHAGTLVVRERFTPYWRIVRGAGCVARGPGGMTRLDLTAAGSVRVETRFAPARLVDHGPRCS